MPVFFSFGFSNLQANGSNVNPQISRKKNHASSNISSNIFSITTKLYFYHSNSFIINKL